MIHLIDLIYLIFKCFDDFLKSDLGYDFLN
jgi:hypothetical protein